MQEYNIYIFSFITTTQAKFLLILVGKWNNQPEVSNHRFFKVFVKTASFFYFDFTWTEEGTTSESSWFYA